MVRNMSQQLRVGATVRVPWGLEADVKGKIVEVWGDPPAHVRVQLLFDGDEDSEPVVLLLLPQPSRRHSAFGSTASLAWGGVSGHVLFRILHRSSSEAERVLSVLNRHGVTYIVVGGTAANLHGAARVTQDFDFVPDSSLDNFGRLATAMHELNARLRVEGLTTPRPRSSQTRSTPRPTPTGRERVSATVTTGSSSLATVTERPLMLSDFECRWMRRCPQNTPARLPVGLGRGAPGQRTKSQGRQ